MQIKRTSILQVTHAGAADPVHRTHDQIYEREAWLARNQARGNYNYNNGKDKIK